MSQQLQHTKGKWEIDNRVKTSINSGTKHIAMVNYNHSGDERDVSSEEHEANVRLISCAPELLNNLIFLYTYMSSSPHEWGSIFRNITRDTIVKATGMTIEEVLKDVAN